MVAMSPGMKLAQPNEDRPETYGMSDEQIFEKDTGLQRRTETVDKGIFGGLQQVYDYNTTTRQDPRYEQNRAAIMAMMQRAPPTEEARAAVNYGATRAQGATINQGPQGEIRSQQAGFLGVLRDAAMGNGPSAAMAQLNLGTDRAMSGAMSLANSQRGGNRSVALKQALGAQAQMQQQAGNEAAMLRAQEMNAARGMYQGAMGDVRGQDLGLALNQAQLQQQASLQNAQLQTQVGMQNAGFQQQTNLANMQGRTQQNQFQAERERQLMAGLMSYDQAQTQNRISQEQFNADLLARQEAARLGVAMQAASATERFVGASAQGLGSAIGTATSAATSGVR